MTTTAPTIARTLDYFTWNRDFHGIRPRDTDDARPVKLNAAAHAVACAIAAHINRQSGEATLGIRRIAESAQVSTSTARAAVKAIEAAGWIKVTRSTRPGTQSNGTSTYELASPVRAARAQAETAPQPLAHLLAEVWRESLHPVAGIATPCSGNRYETTVLTSSLTPRDEKTSPSAVASAPESVDKSIEWKHRDGERTTELLPLHPEWIPNNANRALAAELGLDATTEAAAFRATVTAREVTSRQWGAVFGEYLKRTAEGTVPDMFRWGLEAEDTRAAHIAAQTVATLAELDAPSSPVSVETAPEVPATPDTDTDAPTDTTGTTEDQLDDDTARRWTFASGSEPAPVIDHEAERAQVLAMFTPEHPRAEREAQRRQITARKVAAALPYGIKRAERLTVEAMLDQQATAREITEAIRNQRRAARNAAAADLHTRRAVPVPA